MKTYKLSITVFREDKGCYYTYNWTTETKNIHFDISYIRKTAKVPIKSIDYYEIKEKDK